MPLIDAIRARSDYRLAEGIVRKVDDGQLVVKRAHVRNGRRTVRRNARQVRDFFGHQRIRLKIAILHTSVQRTVSAGRHVADRRRAALEHGRERTRQRPVIDTAAVDVEFRRHGRICAADDGHMRPALQRQHAGKLPAADAARHEILGHVQRQQDAGRFRRL